MRFTENLVAQNLKEAGSIPDSTFAFGGVLPLTLMGFDFKKLWIRS